MLELDNKTRLNLEQARVLLIEDPQPGAEILAQVFFGYGVRQPVRCVSPDEAMARLEEEPFELIVCDGDLPGGQAYDFVMRLRRSTLEPNRYCPVILLSGHTPSAYVAKARDCGANFVVAKPIRPMVLLERIVWVCGDNRIFVELDSYVGPDRRFQSLGPPPGMEGRRKGDRDAVGEASTPNLSQDEIDGAFGKSKKVEL
ncbi:MAG TPA: response regulator [Caulobacteraceae bacterium]|jgi:CheY-like chemotaxis protein